MDGQAGSIPPAVGGEFIEIALVRNAFRKTMHYRTGERELSQKMRNKW